MKNRDMIIRVGSSLAIILIMYLLLTKVISPALASEEDDFKSMFVVVSMILGVVLLNVISFAFMLEEMRKILMGEGIMFLALLLPLKSDIALRDYYADFQHELGEESLSSITAILPMISSVLFMLAAFIWLPFTMWREGISYMTRELGLVAIVVLILFTLTQILRNYTVTKIVKACEDHTYINNPSKYMMVAVTIGIGWAIIFIGSPLLSLIGINISHPVMNIIGLVLPITVLPIYTYIGIKKTRKDMTMDYDMDI